MPESPFSEVEASQNIPLAAILPILLATSLRQALIELAPLKANRRGQVSVTNSLAQLKPSVSKARTRRSLPRLGEAFLTNSIQSPNGDDHDQAHPRRPAARGNQLVRFS